MALTKRIVYGSTLAVDTSGGSSYTTLGNIVDGWDGPSAERSVIDTSVLADEYITKAPGQIDPGEVTFVIAYDPADANTNELEIDGGVYSWQANYKDSTSAATETETFDGFVSSKGVAATGKDGLVTCSITITITGNPGLTGSGA